MKYGCSGLVLAGFFLCGSVCKGDNASLPDRYVDFVEATGSQYFDLGVVGRCGTKADFAYAWGQIGKDSSDQCVLGSRKDSGNTRFNMMWRDFRFNPQPGYGMWYNVDAVTNKYDQAYHVVADFQSAARTLSMDGTTVWTDTTSTYGELNTGYNLYLFACNFAGAAKYFANARCYGVKIWQDGTLVRDMKPCVKDGKGALYDEVSKLIFYPLGGEVIYPYKTETFVEYIESTGSQYVDTYVVGKSHVKAKMDVMWTKTPTTDECFLGCRKDSEDTRFNLLSTDQNLKLYPGYGTYGKTDDFLISAGRRYVFESDFSATGCSVKADGKEVFNSVLSSTSVDAENTLYAFAQDYAGEAKLFANVRCYRLKIWQNGVLVRDFRPCVVGGRGALYDRLSECVFPVQGDTPVGFGEAMSGFLIIVR